MPAEFDLVVTADSAAHTADFRLLDARGVQLAYHCADFARIKAGQQRALFDLRNYVRLFVEKDKELAAIAEIGVCIAEHVLGKDIFNKLSASKVQRTLRVCLPGAGDADNQLAAALARVPWEIARPRIDAPSLGESNLLVRIVHEVEPDPVPHVALAPDEPLRVLFVFAEARGSRPLGARQERRELLRLFSQEIYRQRRVVAHFLTHGVTRERLTDQIQRHNGYHIVHWSGHGHRNTLELARPGGAKDHLSGDELLELFHDAGGFLPRLVFLSACHSGDILQVRDWNEFLAVAQGKEPGARAAEPDAKDLDLGTQAGVAGTAHALLRGGVPTVVAMRYAVGDDYARKLAVDFYRALLAHEHPKHAAAALNLARKALMSGKGREGAHFAACDHATPVLYGVEQPGLTLVKEVSPDALSRERVLHRIPELTPASHEHFVGRTWELAGLGSDFIGARTGEEVKPVAVITGLGGMGKTALVTETLDLWATRFEWVLLYQAKPNALDFEATLRDIHQRLSFEEGRYFHHVKQHTADAIYRNASPEFTGPDRLARLTRNLVRALKDDAILLVLDNFETNLKPKAEAGAGREVWACQDPAWDACLKALASELAGSASRVLITCRRPLAALSQDTSHAVVLGPLPTSEGALYLRAHPALGRMAFHADQRERDLAQRLLTASRLHPLLMDRLARLAAEPAMRPQLLEALATLEGSKDFAALPALFSSSPGGTRELAYLEDALKVSLDQLIQEASPDARRLLWMIAVANEPVALGLVRTVWHGEEPEDAPLREIQQLLDGLPDAEKQAKWDAMGPAMRAMLDALPPVAARPDLAPLLRYLVNLGLATEWRTGPADDNPNLSCHELVRERIRAWMHEQPGDQGDLTENGIRLAYAGWLATYFKLMLHQDMTSALAAGQQALVYCVQAGDWRRLAGFASSLVTSTKDQRQLMALIPHLQSAAASAPEGELRWSCLGYLADALKDSGRPDESLPFYEQAAAAARAATEADGRDTGQAWSDLAWITGNWAGACMMKGDLDGARRRHIDSAEADRKAGAAAARIVGSELEVLRIDIMRGQSKTALPLVEARLAQAREWWNKHRAGEAVPEAPNAETLARTFISALDIARQAAEAQGDDTAALGHLDALLDIERTLERSAHLIGATRYNRANVLMRLERLDEARDELEACHELFHDTPDMRRKTLTSLASLFSMQGDVAQAVKLGRRSLALTEDATDPASRAVVHHNLAIYLSAPDTAAESARHLLAGLLYRTVAGLSKAAQSSMYRCAYHLHIAHETGEPWTLPRISELLDDPAFDALRQWLRQRQENLETRQKEVDELLERLRQAVAEPD